MTINRSILMKIHTLLAVFLLPVAIMFFVTGALYIWEIKGSQEKYQHSLQIDNTFTGELSDFLLLTKNKLKVLGLPTPTGDPKLRKERDKTVFDWSGSSIEVKVEALPKAHTAQMEIKKASWYRHLVQLHKAKGGLLFKLYATILSIALLTLLFTGFIMAWQMPKLRKLTVITTISGFVVFLLLVIYS